MPRRAAGRPRRRPELRPRFARTLRLVGAALGAGARFVQGGFAGAGAADEFALVPVGDALFVEVGFVTRGALGSFPPPSTPPPTPAPAPRSWASRSPSRG